MYLYSFPYHIFSTPFVITVVFLQLLCGKEEPSREDASEPP